MVATTLCIALTTSIATTWTSAWAKDDNTAEPLPPIEATRCIACDADAAPSIESYSSADWERLREGKILASEDVPKAEDDGSSTRGGRAVRAAGFIPHPPTHVWQTLLDFDRWPEFMPHITETAVSQVQGSRMWVHQRYRIALARLQHTTIYDLAPRDGIVRWTLDLQAEHDIAASEGRWLLVPIDDGRSTLVRYRARMDPGRSLPGFVEDLLLRSSIRDLIRSLRREVARRSAED